MAALERVEAGLAVPEICEEVGVSTATFYKWRAKFGGMDTSMISRMKELEDENRRLKKMYLEEKLMAEIVNETSQKSSSAISPARDGPRGCAAECRHYSGRLRGVLDQ